jgi:hypothetical protein
LDDDVLLPLAKVGVRESDEHRPRRHGDRTIEIALQRPVAEFWLSGAVDRSAGRPDASYQVAIRRRTAASGGRAGAPSRSAQNKRLAAYSNEICDESTSS